MSLTAARARPYSPEAVERLRGSITVEHTLARLGAERLRHLLAGEGWVAALGAMTGGQAVQMVRAGLQMPTWPVRPTPIRASTRPTARRHS